MVRLLTGTALHRLLVERHRNDHLTVAGTSAGASALGMLMPCGDIDDRGDALDLCDDPLPGGLGLLAGVVIDQHFTQRRRLARLVGFVSRQGGLVGMGIDEDTAAVIHPGRSLKVVGSGSIALVDGRCAQRSVAEAPVTSLRNVSFHCAHAGTLLHAATGPSDSCGLAAFLP
ncbi:MAG: hypothetical protein EOP38_24640 [Rubrivivax sp.]|nr:MAG: hypothetical protein EOP38_24640 [Rubrivivax sp.]